MKRILCLFLMVSLFFVSGCLKTTKYMKTISNDIGASIADSNNATVVFYRPNIFAGSGVQSSIFDVTYEDTSIIGILPAGNKIIYTVKPSERIFMIIGENADFLKLNLETGKIYYVKVNIAMGILKARFHLVEVAEKELNDQKFKEGLSSAVILEKSEETEKWAKLNAKSINKKRENYFKKFNKKNKK